MRHALVDGQAAGEQGVVAAAFTQPGGLLEVLVAALLEAGGPAGERVLPPGYVSVE
jgi:hypothetical protein